MIRFSALLICVSLSCRSEAPTPPAQPDKTSPPTETPATDSQVTDIEYGRTIADLVFAGKCSELWSKFDATMKNALKTEEAFSATCRRLANQMAGHRFLDSSVAPNNGLTRYTHRFDVSGTRLLLLVTWSGDRQVAGLLVQPEQPPAVAPSKYEDYRTKTELRLPFADTWTVFWGGRTLEENYHVAHANQHFALDLVIMKNGRSHGASGKNNDDYYCFGKPILAAGGGVVVERADGIADNIPGQMNAEQILGNHVIIDHGNGEFSLYAHLAEGSVQVAKDESVGPGQLLGKCGNSGNSSEPHLHFHLQDAAAFGAGESMPAQFQRYLADGKLISRGEPTQRQEIRPATPSDSADNADE